MAKTFVGIQIGAISFIDEGVEQVLDILQGEAGVNALMISALSWSYGNAGRATYGFPDHGVAEPDNLQGGAFFEPNPLYYGATDHKNFTAPDPLYKGFDTLADVIPAAKARGIKCYTYYCETSSSAQRHIWQPGWHQMLDRDHWGKTATRPSLMNPHYRAWWRSVIDDWFSNHELDGMLWGIERQSPLMDIFRADSSTGFDEYFVAEGRARGIDPQRAIEGYRKIDQFLQGVRKGDRPRDGVFVTLLRHLLHHPEVLMWEKMWLDAHQSMYHEVAGAIKFYDPKHEVGLGIWQIINTYNPYLKAQYDQSDYGLYADFLKPVLYNTPAGARFMNFSDSWQKGVLADATQMARTTRWRRSSTLTSSSPRAVKRRWPDSRRSTSSSGQLTSSRIPGASARSTPALARAWAMAANRKPSRRKKSKRPRTPGSMAAAAAC